MLAFQTVSLLFLGGQVGLDCLAVCVVVGQGGMDLGQGQMTNSVSNLFWHEAELVPHNNSANRYARPGDPGPATANISCLGDEAPDVNVGCRAAHAGNLMVSFPFVKGGT
jgi:hypothetical protein